MELFKTYKKHFYILGAIFLCLLIAYITFQTPLSGDDWGFALNAKNGNPFEMALSYYNSFSGRFFSEFWEHLASSNKWVWNVINPVMFVLIFVCIYKLSGTKKAVIAIPLVMLAIMLSVDDNLRMETYSWLTGCIYIISLGLSLLYYYCVEKMMLSVSTSLKINGPFTVISNILLFIIGLMMENIAGAMIFGIIVLIMYFWFSRHIINKNLIINLIVSVVAFVIMRSSPGSAMRLLGEHAVWNELSFIGKLANGYPMFLEFTFINNNYLILFSSISFLMLALFGSRRLNNLLKWVICTILIVGVFAVFSFILPIEYNMFTDPNSMFSALFWPLYIVAIAILLWCGLDGFNREKALFFFMVAGVANAAMMYSPIFGSRSSIYTIFYLIIVISIVMESISNYKILTVLIAVISLFVVVDRYNEYIFKYRLVGLIEQERQGIYQYYRDHPEVEEAWIPRFPPFTIHSADINPGMTYHFETFKEYHNLPQDADKIIFYFKEEYK